MVLDTSVKKFKYSTFNKILCVVLSAVCLVCSVSLGVLAVISTEYLGENREQVLSSGFTESSTFKDNLRSDLGEVVNYVYNMDEQDSLTAVLESKKEEIVENAYKEFLKTQSNSNSYYEDGVENTTMVQDEISVFITNFNNSDYYFAFYPEDIRYSADYNSVAYKDEISYKYDIFVSDNQNLYNSEVTPYYYSNSLNLVAKYKDYEMGNCEISKEDALSSQIYIYYENGEFLYGGLSKETAEDILYSFVSDDKKDETTVCLYFNDFPNSENLIFNYGLWNDKYSSLEDFHYIALKFNNNSALVIISAIVLMAVSFISGFYFFSITGRKNDNENAKLLFIDKLPFDIHLVVDLFVGWIFGYFALVALAKINLLSIVFIMFSAMLAFVVWAVLFEISASVSRLLHSDRKIGENLAVVKIFKLFIRICRKIKSAIKQSYDRTITAVTYKPKYMHTYVIAIILGYFCANALLVMFMFAVNDSVLTLLCLTALLALNISVIVYVSRFVRNLDEIICCAKNGEKFTGNREKLPKVLKILVESLDSTNEQLKLAVDKAVRDERLKTELITNVSHDLKTPLTSIISYVDLLSKCDIQDEKAKEYIAVLDDKGSKLKRLIEDLIEASKVTSGNITVNPTKLNLNELCLQAIGEMQSDFEKNSLELIVSESENTPVIFADGLKAFRIYENLLSNAKKYSAQPSRVYVSTYTDGDMGVFEIKNISAQPLNISADELTQRFVRGDKSRTKEGNGLGLSIAKELCKAQGGKLEIIIDGDLFKARAKLPLAK